MSGGGGGGGSSYRPPVQAATPRITPVPQTEINPNMGPAFGPTATANPYVAGNTPSWMNGWFAMPSWGMDPMGEPLTQEQMMYQRPPEPEPEEAAQDPTQQQQQQQQMTPAQQLWNYYNSRYGNTMAGPESPHRHMAATGNRIAVNSGMDAARAQGYSPDYATVQKDKCRESGGKLVNGKCQYG